MRTVVLLDKKIPVAEYKQVIKDYSDFIYENTGITPKFWRQERDFTDYPTYIDSDGDVRPVYTFLQGLADEVHADYKDFGTDNVVVWIHEDNWKSDPPGPNNGIWGTNYSYIFHKYCLQYNRWDRDNLANSFGTLNHEIDHTFDSVCMVETDVDIEPILGVGDYDRDVTHGGSSSSTYIRYQENADTLKKLAPYLKEAYAVRQRKHDQYFAKQTAIITLLQKVIYLLKLVNNRKYGVKK